MRKTLVTVLIISLIAFTGAAFAYNYYPSYYTSYPSSFRTFGATGFTAFHSPTFVGSVLHPATFWSMQTSRVTTFPTYPAWNGFRPAFGFWY